ncbi:MAG TPA: winged helix-turn-helix domain-containing protein [Streptosporangiaceae bacterium]
MSRAAQPIPALSPAHPLISRVRRHVPGAPAGIAAFDDYAFDDYRPGAPDTLRSGDVVLDETRWTVHRAGTPVDLSPTEFRLLACLMRHQGTVLTRSELLRSVWGLGYTGQSQVVETYVSYLRRKLGRLGPPLIHTCRGIGYVLRPEALPAGCPAAVRPAR